MHKLMLYLTQGLAGSPHGSGTVCIALPIGLNLGGRQLATRIRLTNDAAAHRSFSYAFVPDAGECRPHRERIRRLTATVAPRATLVLGEDVSNRPGILEVDAGADFAITIGSA